MVFIFVLIHWGSYCVYISRCLSFVGMISNFVYSVEGRSQGRVNNNRTSRFGEIGKTKKEKMMVEIG
jgi:hypothetical protein